MKFKNLLVLIMVAGLLAVYYIYGTGYLGLRSDNAALASQIAASAEQTALIPPPPGDIEQRRAAASADLDAAHSLFPALLNSTQIVNAIQKLAESAGVKAVPLVTQAWATESVTGVDYPVLRLNVAAAGTYARLADFINRLESGEPETMVIADLTITWGDGLSQSETSGGDDTPLDAVLNISVYGRPLSSENTSKVDGQ